MISKDENTIALLLHDVAHQLRVYIDGKVEPFKLTRLKWLVLAFLDRKDGISQAELADNLDVERSSVGRVLDRMEKRKFIRRERDPDDRRVIRVYIEDDARPLLADLEKVSTEVKEVAVKGLDETEQADLVRLLSKMKENLKFGCSLIPTLVTNFGSFYQA